MVKTTYSTLSVEFVKEIPSSIAEFVTLAKGETVALEIMNDSYMAHTFRTEQRRVFLHGRKAVDAVAATDKTPAVAAQPEIQGVEQLSGISRKFKMTGKDNKVKTWDETEAEYFKRVCAEKAVKPESFGTLMQTVADAIPFDPSTTPRSEAGVKGAAKMWLDQAESVIKAGHRDVYYAKCCSELGITPVYIATGDEAADKNKLAELIRDVTKKRAAEKPLFDVSAAPTSTAAPTKAPHAKKA